MVNIDRLDQKETKNGPKTKCKAVSKLKFAEFTIRMGFHSNFLGCASEYCRGGRVSQIPTRSLKSCFEIPFLGCASEYFRRGGVSQIPMLQDIRR